MNNKILYIIIIGVLIIIGGFFFFSNNKGEKKETTPNAEQAATDNKSTFDCGEASDPGCFMNRLAGCQPVRVKMVSNDGKTSIGLEILGVENDKCHFQRKLDDVLNLDCYFPRGTLNWDTIDQTFGNDKGLQGVVDSACKSAGW